MIGVCELKAVIKPIHATLTVQGVTTDEFCPYIKVYCYLELKHCYLKNMNLLSIRVKELFEPIIVWQRKCDKF